MRASRGRLLAVTSISVATALPFMFAQGPTANAEEGVCPDPSAIEPITVAGEPALGVHQADLPEGTNVALCDLTNAFVLATDGGLAVGVPGAGEAIQLDAYQESADEEAEFAVAVDETYEIAYIEPDPTAIPTGDPPKACDDRTFNLKERPMNPNETFYFNRSTSPNYLNADNVVQTIDESMRAWPQLYNDCGEADDVSVTTTNGGNSEAQSTVVDAVDSSGKAYTGCDPSRVDSISIVNFGKTPGTFAATCQSYDPNSSASAFAGDIKINEAKTWTRTPNQGCTSEIDLRSVVTHEAGHYWGLTHVDPSEHPNLTMRNGGTKAVQCNDMLRTLGLGDVKGMRVWFG